jgi:alkylated DNA nucleotide flippase Atl1
VDQPGPVAGSSGESYVDLVLDLVDRIPAGRVMTYGGIADVLRERVGRGAARMVGNVMARYGAAVAWHRVVAADGRLPPGHEDRAAALLRAEGVPFRGAKVDVAAASWWPAD